jgi:predicted ATPase/DNA-binding CsgD family transcriptional regulator
MADPAISGAGDARGRLPRPRTSFVGRESELTQARHLLGRHRLLTLTGPGGCGKTRLSIALAAGVMGAFPDGVRFVPLAAISDASLVPVSIAQGMGLQDSRGGSLLEHLSGYVGDRKVLLVLDNFEHLLSAGEFVQELLARSTQLRILVTSRSPLHLSGEQEFPVPALPVPEPGGAPSVTAVAACESAQLFAARAAALVPGFAIGEQNAGAIAGIVTRLDGLPLAIELAAARVKLLPPAAILARLEDSLGLLVSGGRDAPDRQRTLRATIAWSYDLLSEAARRLLAAASVFRGGISLDSIEAVCAEALHLGVPVLDALQELVDHSLLRLAVPSAPVPRYALLETVGEFAAEQLGTMPEAAAIRAAQAAQFGRLAKDLARPPCWPARDGLDLLALEHDNFRVALDWYRREDPSAGLRLANRLTAFWSARGHFSEGRRRLGELLELVPGDDPERVDALNGAAWLATDQGDRASAIPLLNESIERARATHDVVREATALYYRGRAKQSVGDPAGGGADIARALELQTGTGDDAGLAAALWWAGASAMFEDDLGLAIERFERCAELSGALGLPAIEARALQLLGVSRLELGDLRGAKSALGKGVPAIADIGDRFAIPVGLSALAGLAAKGGRPRAALRLAGAAAAYEEVNKTYRPQKIRAFLDAWLAPVRTTAGTAAAKLFDEGRGLAPGQAIALGLDDKPEDRWPGGGPPASLTRREREIAALVATGLTNRQIAGQLYLSVRTVEVHVDHILSKLGFRTRTQLAAWMHEEGLAPRIT